MYFSLLDNSEPIQTEVLQALPKDCLSTSLDRTSVNGPGHSTASSGGQDGGHVELLHEQAQEDTGEEMDVLSSTLDYNSSSGLTDIGYRPNPNVCYIMRALLFIELIYQTS